MAEVGELKNWVGQSLLKQGGFPNGDGSLWAMGTGPKALWNFLYFQCYLDDISMTLQMAEPRSWQWPSLGCEVRLSVAFEPLYWLCGKPISPWEKLIKGSKIFWFYSELHVTRGREERQAGAKWLLSLLSHDRSRTCELFSTILFPSQETFMSMGRGVHFSVFPVRRSAYILALWAQIKTIRRNHVPGYTSYP